MKTIIDNIEQKLKQLDEKKKEIENIQKIFSISEEDKIKYLIVLHIIYKIIKVKDR